MAQGVEYLGMNDLVKVNGVVHRIKYINTWSRASFFYCDDSFPSMLERLEQAKWGHVTCLLCLAMELR